MLRKAISHLFLLSTAIHGYLISRPVSPEGVLSCGSTPDEAKELDCHFDMFSFAWYPRPCWNEDLHRWFYKVHVSDIDWRLKDYTPITPEEVMKGVHESLRPITGQFHDLHCTYEWLRLIRAMAEERRLDKKLSEFAHSQHCSGRLLEKDKSGRNQTANTHAELLYGSCGLTADEMHEYGAKGYS